VLRDYGLVGPTSDAAREKGLSNAAWYRSPVPHDRIRELMKRSDGRAIRDTLLWLGIFIVSGTAGFVFWGGWWAVPAFFVYGTVWGSSSDSRWHECGHQTAFKTKWMNAVIYHFASFMVLREGTVWRRSHQRHHADTIIVGLDPEISVMRPPKLGSIALSFIGLPQAKFYIQRVVRHALGNINAEEKTYIPDYDYGRVIWEARIHIAVYAVVAALAVATDSILPLMYVGLPSLYGAWLYILTGLTQHAGLAEDVLDHRLVARTVYMNPVVRFLYWNMNYHVEHHMFPVVPYYALPQLHDEMKADTPRPYSGFVEAYREIIPTLLRQAKDPTYFVRRELPLTARPSPQTGQAAAAS
jgi:fatty acid desaturase